MQNPHTFDKNVMAFFEALKSLLIRSFEKLESNMPKNGTNRWLLSVFFGLPCIFVYLKKAALKSPLIRPYKKRRKNGIFYNFEASKYEKTAFFIKRYEK